jgi:hypothetical protein
MIGWLNPAALWALPLAAAPILIHLLRTHHAERVAFPSLRFVPRSQAAAVRMRLPSDVALLLMLVALIVLAVVALAGPIVLTAPRTAAWNARTARAVVVDASDSMRVPDLTGAALERAAAEAAAAEIASATYGVRIDSRDLRQGIARASTWLAASPPARREVVVVSDFKRGGLTSSTTVAIGDGIGLRFVSVGRRPDAARFEGRGSWEPVSLRQATRRSRRVTRRSRRPLTRRPWRAASAAGDAAGLRLVGPADAERTRTLATGARAGRHTRRAQPINR